MIFFSFRAESHNNGVKHVFKEQHVNLSLDCLVNKLFKADKPQHNQTSTAKHITLLPPGGGAFPVEGMPVKSLPHCCDINQNNPKKLNMSTVVVGFTF